MRFIAWSQTDVGKRRAHNEDSHLVRAQLGLFAVADGMGGHQAGETASRMAIEVLEREMNGAAGSPSTEGVPSPPGELVRLAAEQAGAAIFDASQSEKAMHGMGTTLTALFAHSGRAHLAHVGDSRCYLYRKGGCKQLTQDHSWVGDQMRAGLLSEAEARESKYKHVITRSVGFERNVLVDCSTVTIEPGDCFVLCTDGLSNYVDESELAEIMTACFYRKVPSTLVALANDRGGEDNITVIIVQAAND